MRSGWRRPLAGFLVGVLAGTAALAVEAAGRDGPAAAPERQLREVMHSPPLLVAPGEPLLLRYEAVCAKDELGTRCGLSGRVFVRTAGERQFAELPLASDGDATLSAAVPERFSRAGPVEYFAVIESDDGESLTLPPAGAASPQRATPLADPVTVELGRHGFGDTRRPVAVAARARWGDGAGELGLDAGPEQGRIGPSAFDVTAGGTVVVLDQVNRRLARFAPGRQAADHVRIPFAGGEGDLAVAPDGTAHVLDDGGAARRPVVRSFSPSGEPLAATPLGAPSADMLRLGPAGPVAHAYPAEMWLPTASTGASLRPADQRARARPGRPVAGGLEVVVRAYQSEARFALVHGDHVVRSWRVTSATPLGEVQLAEPHRGGLLVVLRLWTESQAEFRVLEFTPAGLATSFAVDRAEWAESAPLSRFRLAGNRLYQLRTAPEGAEIVHFDLGGER